MTAQLKPLLLPQWVEQRAAEEERKQMELYYDGQPCDGELPFVYQTTNSSSSDIGSPLTPTFSARGHFRGSSSTSSLDISIAQLQPQECPSSPNQLLAKKASMCQLPDVQEEPIEIFGREVDMDSASSHIDLYSCLCDEPCEHRSTDGRISGDLVSGTEFEYDMSCLSDGEASLPRKLDFPGSPLSGFTNRLGSRFNTMRWRSSSRKASLMSSPTTEVSFENALSRGTSTRSSSVSSHAQRMPSHLYDSSSVASPTVSVYPSRDELDSFRSFGPDGIEDQRSSIERDRALATTPLLPPLAMKPAEEPRPESPLQSPTIEPSSAGTDFQSPQTPAYTPRPSLGTRPSNSSLRHVLNGMDLPLPPPGLLQDHDEWSDRLGHANFNIIPQPYEVGALDNDTFAKFCNDWELARANYTKHLVRVGENYGQTSKTYSLTEAKWAEIDGRWQEIYDGLVKQTGSVRPSARKSTVESRSRSRGRGRMRSGSATGVSTGRVPNDDFADAQWERLNSRVPNAVPHMMDGDGKFPSLGDEDIVGPMHRVATMERSQSEEKYGAKLWKNLVEKVSLKR